MSEEDRYAGMFADLNAGECQCGQLAAMTAERDRLLAFMSQSEAEVYERLEKAEDELEALKRPSQNALRKDKARLDWIEELQVNGFDNDEYIFSLFRCGGRTFREAIDNEMDGIL